MRIAYVGIFEFPEGDAGAARVLGIGMALQQLGHSVVFMGIEKMPMLSNVSTGYSISDYQGFKYRSPVLHGNSLWRRLSRQISIFSGASIIERLHIEEAENGPLDMVISYLASSLLMLRLFRWCSRRQIPIVCDSVEWFDPSHVLGGRFSPIAFDSELRMRKITGMSDGVITISKYLDEYYKGKGSKTICIPPLVDIGSGKWPLRTRREKDGRLHIAFVGNAGRKDLLIEAIRGLALLGKDSTKCLITIVGPTEMELRTNLKQDAYLLETLSESLCFTGRLTHREALEQLAQADFSIVLRPDARFAHAGFPTKLVESLAMGVPVICNITGDIGMYVRDGKEGIIVTDCTPEAFAVGLYRALKLTSDNKITMNQTARKCAENYFDYRNWMDPLRDFLKLVTVSRRRSLV